MPENNENFDIFCELARIPSPSRGEDCVTNEILTILKSLGIDGYKDEIGNVIGRIPATDATKQSLLLSAHTDVVGNATPVNIEVRDGVVMTDGTRTLGADDKAGVTAAIACAKRVSEDKNLKHGGLELVFTIDEEQNMTGIKNLDFSRLNSKYVIVADSDKLGDMMIAGAGYKKLTLTVTSAKSGHSGVDIGDETKVNAAYLLFKIGAQIPQGVFKADETGTLTSINLGVAAGGGLERAFDGISAGEVENGKYFEYVAENAVTNVINKNATAVYSLRSSDSKSEAELIGLIKGLVDKYNEEYKNRAKFELKIEEHMPAFQKSTDTRIPDAAREAAKALNIPFSAASFHAGAETHIYANNTNSVGERFLPYLAGVADIYNMHSPDEKMDIASFLNGCEFLYKIFLNFNK